MNECEMLEVLKMCPIQNVTVLCMIIFCLT